MNPIRERPGLAQQPCPHPTHTDAHRGKRGRQRVHAEGTWRHSTSGTFTNAALLVEVHPHVSLALSRTSPLSLSLSLSLCHMRAIGCPELVMASVIFCYDALKGSIQCGLQNIPAARACPAGGRSQLKRHQNSLYQTYSRTRWIKQLRSHRSW
jgi:hypothetical protein